MEFGDVIIVIYPLKNNLFKIKIDRKPGVSISFLFSLYFYFFSEIFMEFFLFASLITFYRIRLYIGLQVAFNKVLLISLCWCILTKTFLCYKRWTFVNLYAINRLVHRLWLNSLQAI